MDDSISLINIPSLTVVVPSLNQAETIEQTLTSILDHNNPEGLEVLVFDSMSTDGTSDILDRWESRCTIIREKDGGQSDALNKGFIKAKGEIICWLNSDDIFFPNALDQVRQRFLENPSAQVISGRGVHLYASGHGRLLPGAVGLRRQPLRGDRLYRRQRHLRGRRRGCGLDQRGRADGGADGGHDLLRDRGRLFELVC